MLTYINVLPIEFGGGVCHALPIGFEPDFAALLVQEPSAFKHRGRCFTLQVSPTAVTVVLDPADLHPVLLPMLTDGLCRQLTRHGRVIPTADGLHFLGEDTKGSLDHFLTVEFDDHHHRYQVVMRATKAGDAYDEYMQFQRLACLLVGSQFDFVDAKIGAHPPQTLAKLNRHDLLFSVDGTRYHQHAREGLVRYGPYSAVRMSETRIALRVYVDLEHKSSASQWLQELKMGRQNGAFGDRPFQQGMAQYFRFAGLDLYLEGTLPKDEMAAGDCLDKPLDHLGPVVVCYFSDQVHLALEGQSIARGLPCHRIAIQQLRHTGDTHDLDLFNHALTLYAKCKGEPWLLYMPKRLEYELVIGVGSHPTADGVRGYATVFSSQGNYKLGDANWKGSAADWAVHMGDFLTKMLYKLPAFDGWNSKSSISLLFHFDQRPSAASLESIRSRICDEFGGTYDLTISFLLATYVHPYQVWDKARYGLHQNGRHLGRYQPPMGTVAKLGTRKALVQMTGPDSEPIMTRPLLVESLPGSQDQDFDYQVDQVFYFRQFSWQSFQPAALPVTLAYGAIVAEKCHALHAENPFFSIHDNLLNIPWYL